MANVDRLARAENEYETLSRNIAAMQTRLKEVQQRVLKLRSEKILDLVKNAGMGPNELKEMLTLYQKGQMPRRIEARNAETNVNTDTGGDGQEERSNDETY